MAKIWDKIKDKLNSEKERLIRLDSQTKLMRYRRNLDFVNIEINELDDKYNAKQQAKRNSFVRSANSKLAKPAFLACDKQEYIDFVLEEKLKKFDKSRYMSLRALNTSTARSLFNIIKKIKKLEVKAQKDENFEIPQGQDYSTLSEVVFAKHSEKRAKLDDKRVAFLQKLDKKRENFIAKNSITSSEAYDMLNSELKEKYNSMDELLTSKLAIAKQKECDRLSLKKEKLTNKIDAITANHQDRCGVPDDVILRVQNLKMYFGGLKAVDDLTFDVKRGEIFGLIGPNGAGKTTVFNCITRFYNATGGDMLFENKHGEIVDMRDFKVHDVILQGITRTFQNIELVREISVLENLLVACTRSYRTGVFAHAIGLPLLKKEERVFRQKAMQILKFMGIESYAAWNAMGLPYGILKKVEIARALMGDTKLIIMDEPAAGLNDVETKELTETIRKIRDTFGVTILLVEHEKGHVMNVCDTVCAISFGQMLAIGNTEEIQQNKAVQEAYLGVSEDETPSESIEPNEIVEDEMQAKEEE